MNSNQLISVILPVYNAEKYLELALMSILQQSYTHFELLIINDGSTDGSKEIIQSHNDDRIVYIENEVNLGLIKTLNKGLKLAKGEFIARMDADDLCFPMRFQKQIEYFEKYKVDVLGTEIIFINDVGKRMGKGVGKLESMPITPFTFLQRSPLYHPTTMFRRKIIDQGHFYRENYPHAEDYELWVRLSKEYKLDLIDEPLLYYRVHGDSITSQYNDEGIQSVSKALMEHLEVDSEDKELLPFVRFKHLRSSQFKAVVDFLYKYRKIIGPQLLAQILVMEAFPFSLYVMKKFLFRISIVEIFKAKCFFIRALFRKKFNFC